MKSDILICNCCSCEHQLVITYFPEDDIKEVYVYMHLIPIRKWYKRLYHAIKYLFGYKCKYGDFEEIILDKSHINKLQNIINILR